MIQVELLLYTAFLWEVASILGQKIWRYVPQEPIIFTNFGRPPQFYDTSWS